MAPSSTQLVIVSANFPSAVAAPEPQPKSEGHAIMQAQRAAKKRLFLLQHCKGKPIRGRQYPVPDLFPAPE